MAVTVTNSAGTSAAANVTMLQVQPGLFTSSNYIQAVRSSDNALVNATAAAKPGDTLELYGTGFGPTSPTASDGVVFSGAYPTTNAVTVTVGGIQANVLWAGLVAAGLYQINVTIPTGLADGDYAVVASIAGLNSQSNALVKIASA